MTEKTNTSHALEQYNTLDIGTQCIATAALLAMSTLFQMIQQSQFVTKAEQDNTPLEEVQT